MDRHEWLAEQFEGNRARLQLAAYRMLGSASEAEDAVQEAWLRLSRSDTSEVQNLAGWLTTVVARVCLDMLRSRESRREEPLSGEAPEPPASPDAGADPEREAILAESVGLAMLVVLETLTPPERVAFVLHDTFGVPFEDIASIVGRSPDATRQLASRARRRVRGAADPKAADEPVRGAPAAQAGSQAALATASRARQQAIVRAFLAAARGGDFAALLSVLDPNVVLRADAAVVASGGPAELRGAEAVAGQFAGRAQAAQPALVEGVPGLAWAPGGQPRVVFALSFAGDKITGIEMIGSAERVAELELTLLEG